MSHSRQNSTTIIGENWTLRYTFLHSDQDNCTHTAHKGHQHRVANSCNPGQSTTSFKKLFLQIYAQTAINRQIHCFIKNLKNYIFFVQFLQYPKNDPLYTFIKHTHKLDRPKPSFNHFKYVEYKIH